jgi:hypothetical protein
MSSDSSRASGKEIAMRHFSGGRMWSVTMDLVSNFPAKVIACEGPLDLHQPDPGFPDRMVGVCMRCGRWYLLDSIPGTEEALMVLLPDGESFQKVQRV